MHQIRFPVSARPSVCPFVGGKSAQSVCPFRRSSTPWPALFVAQSDVFRRQPQRGADRGAGDVRQRTERRQRNPQHNLLRFRSRNAAAVDRRYQVRGHFIIYPFVCEEMKDEKL